MSVEPVKLLVVDDEDDILTYSKNIFSKNGFKVFTAADSDTALDICRKEHPQICLLDVHMPFSSLDGVQLLGKIRELDKGAYCIILSRVMDKDKIEAARELGAQRYVIKPIQIPELLKALEEAKKEFEKH